MNVHVLLLIFVKLRIRFVVCLDVLCLQLLHKGGFTMPRNIYVREENLRAQIRQRQRSRVNVKVGQGSTWTFARNLSYICVVSYTHSRTLVKMRFMLTRWLVWVKGSKFTRRVEQRGCIIVIEFERGCRGGVGLLNPLESIIWIWKTKYWIFQIRPDSETEFESWWFKG